MIPRTRPTSTAPEFPDAWMARRPMIFCPHLRLKCAPGYCAKLRKRATLRARINEKSPSDLVWEDARGKSDLVRPGACGQCRGKDAVKIDAETRHGRGQG